MILTFLKGFLMGTCDVVPGISGGTIAFITGIYEKFIRSVKNITTKEFLMMIISFLRGEFKQFKQSFLDLEMDFLLVLLVGIASALFLVSKLVLYLLDNYLSYTLMFFVGLILASTVFIKQEIEVNSVPNYIIGLIGFLIGISLLFLDAASLSEASLLYITFGGFIAISAMFLPGISGSFILLVMGLYDIVYGALHDMFNQWKILLSFGVGVVLGSIVISRLISFLFERDKSMTLYFLLGLVIGGLLVPLKTVYVSMNSFAFIDIFIYACFVGEGILIVSLVNVLSKSSLLKKS